jgi:NifU-like protein involved in Fe-S cluster formation
MKSTLLKTRFIKFLFGLILTGIYLPAVSQNKDSTSKFVIKKSVTCQATLADKSASGKKTNYTLIISADEILKDPYIRTDGCTDYTVSSFAMVLTVNGTTVKKVCTGNKLNSEMLDLVKEISKGSHIIFEDVHYKLPNGQSGVMPGINVLIN